jgi:hypothetical protein
MKKLISASAIVLPAIVMAHPGHGPVENGLSHYLFSPIHMLGIAASVALVVVVYRYYKTSRKQNA